MSDHPTVTGHEVRDAAMRRLREGMRKLVDPKPALPLGGGHDYTSP